MAFKKYMPLIIVQLADQLHEMFDKNIYTLGVFIDLSKAFETVNHKFFLKKLSHYEIKNKRLGWFICYLSNRKQFIGYMLTAKAPRLTLYGECRRDPFLDPCYSCFI